MNPLAKPLIHTWQDEERLSLVLIKTFYRIESKEIAAIFNGIYNARLLKEGHVDGLRTTTLVTMLHELQHRRSHLEPVKTIQSLSLSRLRHKFWKTKNEIEDVALELGIELRLKSKEDHRIRGSLTKRLLNVRYRDRSRTETPSSYFSLASDSDDSPCRGKRRTAHTFRSNTSVWDIQLLSTTKQFDGSTGRKHPTLLYRAFENDHGFLSRYRLEDFSGEEESPPEYGTEAFCALVKPHLIIDEDYISPFISLTQFPKAAIKYLKGRKNCSLAVFDFNSLAADAAERFPDDTIPYLVPSICRDHDIDDLPGGYTGFGEWMAYGSIKAKPLVIWSFDDAQAIERHLKGMKSITFFDGQKLSKYFHTIPRTWKPTIAFQLLCSFKVRGYEQGRNSADLDGFLQGLHQSSTGVSTQSSSPTGDDERITRINNTTSSKRIVLSDSEDEISAIPSQNRTDLTQIAASNLRTFRQQLQNFMAPQRVNLVPSKPEESAVTQPGTTTTTIDELNVRPEDCWEVIDLTEEIGHDNDEVVFQKTRRIAVYKRDLSIRSKSSINT